MFVTCCVIQCTCFCMSCRGIPIRSNFSVVVAGVLGYVTEDLTACDARLSMIAIDINSN